MNTCSTCKHWDAPYEHHHSIEPPSADWGECLLIPGQYVDTPGACAKAYIDALDPYCGESLVTAPDFGCACWEPKE